MPFEGGFKLLYLSFSKITIVLKHSNSKTVRQNVKMGSLTYVILYQSTIDSSKSFYVLFCGEWFCV
jgi:hypothetical protein